MVRVAAADHLGRIAATEAVAPLTEAARGSDREGAVTPAATDPVRWAAVQACMARCLAWTWHPRVSADRCVRERQRVADARAR